MRRDGQAAVFMDQIANFLRRLPFQIGQRRANAKEMSFCRRHLDAGDDEEIIHRHSVLAHQPFFQEVGHPVVGVVIGQGETVQAFRLGRGDILLGT